MPREVWPWEKPSGRQYVRPQKQPKRSGCSASAGTAMLLIALLVWLVTR